MSLLTSLGLPPPSGDAAASPGSSKAAPPKSAQQFGAGDAGVVPPAPAPAPAAGPAAPPAAGAQAGGAGVPPPGPVDKNLAAYVAARNAVQKLVDDLNAHPQKAHIAADIAAATAKIAGADAQAAAKAYPKASQALLEAKTIAARAKKLADDWATYAKQLGDAMALGMAFSGNDYDWTTWGAPVIAAANALVNANPPKFAAAGQKLTSEINASVEPWVKDRISDAKATLATIVKTGASAQVFAKAEIDEGKGYIANALKAMTSREWSVSVQNADAALRVLGPTARVCARRTAFDSQRKATTTAIDKLRASPDLKDQAAALDQQVVAADALAAAERMKIEAGVAALQATAAQAGIWAGLVKTIAAHAKDRASADAELAALDGHVAAAKIASQRDAVRKILADEKALADGAAAAPEPAAEWNAATTALARARVDLAAARKLADGLAAASTAEAAAGQPGDLKALKAALGTLQADGTAASKAPGAVSAKAEFDAFGVQAKAAAAALAAADGATAAAALGRAATALVAAKGIQASHAQFASLLVSVESQLKTLKQSPRAKSIQPRIDPVANGLADAKAKDQAHAGNDALIALRAASDAIAAAKAADLDRDRFDKRAAVIGKRVAKVADATSKAALQALDADAGKDADALAFADAGGKLDQVDVGLDKGQAETLMKAAKPNAAALKQLAAKMVGQGGRAAVDKLIHDIPDGSDPSAMSALAEGRYGVKFKIDKPMAAKPAVLAKPAAGGKPAVPGSPAVPAGDSVKAMREVCDMFATIPEDIVKSPSVKGIEYKDAIGKNGRKTAGGSFNYGDAKIRMLGRAGIMQQFGAAQTSADPKTNTAVSQLPAVIDDACQPKNADAVDFLNFAAAHEVGHAVDDARGFMARNGHQDKFGGWTNYGASVQPIADAVGADPQFAEFYKTPEQRQYVLNKLLNKPAVAPTEVPNSAADNARKAFDIWYQTATSPNVYRRQGDCAALKLGDYVYHEAYQRQWVRYLFAARSKALTGYQFRAPGEWFAELYAGYRSGKLKDNHPAMEWLTTL